MAEKSLRQVDEQVFSITADCPFAAYVSPNRNFMAASHRQQSIELLTPDQKITQSGLEKEMGANTFSIEIEKDCEVLKVIERSEMRDDRDEVVELLILVKDEDDFIDYYRVPYHFQLNKKFGFKYKSDAHFLRNLRTGHRFQKGDILADSHAVKDGNLCMGVNANVALLSIQGVAEDAIIISKSFAERLSFRVFKTTRIDFGSTAFPLNMYGDEHEYKPFPAIGELVREDGILAALRKYDDDEVIFNTSNYDLSTHDKDLDMRFVVPPGGMVEMLDGTMEPTGRVVDIEVFCNSSKLKSKQELYPHTLGEINRHAETTEVFYRNILDAYKQIADSKDPRIRWNGKINNPVKLRERMWNLVYKAMVIANKDGSKGSQRIPLRFKASDQDIYIANITTEHIVKAHMAIKLTDQYGSKGVVVDIWDDDKMPRTKDGVVADIIMDPSSLPSRSNIGRVYEQYFNAASRKARSIVREAKTDEEAWHHVLSFLEAYGGPQYEYYCNATDEEKREILKEIREEEFYIHYSVSATKKAHEVVRDIEKTIYKPLIDNILINYRGKLRETKFKAIIGPIYTVLLSKLPEDFIIACGTPRFNHYMIPVGQSNSQKLSEHITKNPLKIFGETENRMVGSVAGPEALVELQDRNCNPKTIEHIIEQFLTLDTPGYVDELVNRDEYKFGGNSALELMKHIMEVGGVGLKYIKDKNYDFDETMIPGIGMKK